MSRSDRPEDRFERKDDEQPGKYVRRRRRAALGTLLQDKRDAEQHHHHERDPFQTRGWMMQRLYRGRSEREGEHRHPERCGHATLKTHPAADTHPAKHM